MAAVHTAMAGYCSRGWFLIECRRGCFGYLKDNRCDDLVKQVLDPVTLVVDVAAEAHFGGHTIWQPRQMRVTYKAVVIVPSDTTTYDGPAHYYAASCLPIQDGKGGWLLYDGAGVEHDPCLVTEVKGTRLMEHISQRKDRVCVIIMQKLTEEKIDWVDRSRDGTN